MLFGALALYDCAVPNYAVLIAPRVLKRQMHLSVFFIQVGVAFPSIVVSEWVEETNAVLVTKRVYCVICSWLPTVLSPGFAPHACSVWPLLELEKKKK